MSRFVTRSLMVIGAVALAAGTGPGLAARPPAGSSPSMSQLAARSNAVLKRLNTVHAAGSVSAWSRLPGKGIQQLIVRVTANCTVHTSAGRGSGWQRVHVLGTFRQAGKPDQVVDTHWIFFGSSRKDGTDSHYSFWERSAATHGRWKKLSLSLAVQEPAYSVYLASGGLCGVSFSRVIPVAHYRFLGAEGVGGRTTWHVRGQFTGRDGEFFDQQLFIDRQTYQVDRAGLIYREPLNGRDVARQHALMTYSAFNSPLTIGPPRVGASTP